MNSEENKTADKISEVEGRARVLVEHAGRDGARQALPNKASFWLTASPEVESPFKAKEL